MTHCRSELHPLIFKPSIGLAASGGILSRRRGRRILTVIAMALALTGCAPEYYSGPPSEHFDGARFFNPGSKRELPPFAFWRWRLTRERGFWPDWVDGAYEPRWFMAYAHQTPEEAVRAHLDARACFSLATQHHTFPMADESYEQPLHDLAAARLRHGTPEASFRALQNGEYWWTPRLAPISANRWRCSDGRIIG